MDLSPRARLGIKPWFIWTVAALFPMYQFMLQGFPSVMLGDLTQDLSISFFRASFITTFFFFSYIVMQIPAGVLVDIYGPRILLILGTALAGAACMVFSCCKALWIAELSRLFMGFVCSPGIVAVFFLASQWFHPQRFALVVGLTETLCMSGAGIASIGLAAAVCSWGWRLAIFFVGAIGLFLSILMLLIVRNRPEDNSLISHRAQIFSMKIELKNLLVVVSRFQVWASGIYMGLVFSVIPAFFALWGIPFMMKNYSINSTQAATINALGLVGAGIGGPFLGWLSDRIRRRKGIMIFSSLTSLGLAWCILRLSIPMHLAPLFNFLLGFCLSGYIVGFAIIKEILPKEAKGKGIGFGNTLCLLFGAPVMQPVIASLMKRLSGQEDAMRLALTPILIAFAASLLLSFFIKETYCKDVAAV